MNEAFLILGSNINPESNIPKALDFLSKSFLLDAISNTWITKSVGTEAADFLNTAVKIRTPLDQNLLKEKCLCHIEEIMGRVRVKNKNAPRTIDIDIVIFNGTVQDPNLFNMDHLILPFSELLPKLHDPTSLQTLQEISRKTLEFSCAKKYGLILPAEK
jgi:2-amino-4-hydroxy-6-hydroxymethyldihydropteridine diphosphokinase